MAAFGPARCRPLAEGRTDEHTERRVAEERRQGLRGRGVLCRVGEFDNSKIKDEDEFAITRAENN
jgi:hypothetical protein